jgi:hypothetical protein
MRISARAKPGTAEPSRLARRIAFKVAFAMSGLLVAVSK